MSASESSSFVGKDEDENAKFERKNKCIYWQVLVL